jgi:hypothetical protein
MSIVLPVLGIVYAGIGIWLGVRIFNRRELWSKWTLTAVVGLPVLYVASFGPACWIARSEQFPALGMEFKVASRIYWPFGAILKDGTPTVASVVAWYATLGAAQFLVPTGVSESSALYGVLSTGSYVEIGR